MFKSVCARSFYRGQIPGGTSSLYYPIALFQSVRNVSTSGIDLKKKEEPKKEEPKKEAPGKPAAQEKDAKDKDKKAGKEAPKQEQKPRMQTFVIYRFTQESKKSPHMQKYTIDLNQCGPMILDALLLIKKDIDPSLSFRRSCREGVCGCCGININGQNGLACLTRIKPRGTIKIYPLPHMYVIKDLITDFTHFLDQHRRVRPYLIRSHPFKTGQKQHLQSLKDRDKLDGLIECILCACCSTSCPSYWWHGNGNPGEEFLGPAALLQAEKWMADSRDQGGDCRLGSLRDYYSVFRCHTINNCTYACPKGLNPAKAIANLKMRLVGKLRKPKPELGGMA